MLSYMSLSAYGQSSVNPTESIQPSKDVLRFSSSYSGYSGLGFKLNYERNLTSNLIAFASAEGNIKYSKWIGIGLKYRILKYAKFEGLVGMELQHGWHDNSLLGYANSRSAVLAPSVEFRYNVSKFFFIGIEASQNLCLKNNCFQIPINRPKLGLSVGYKF